MPFEGLCSSAYASKMRKTVAKIFLGLASLGVVASALACGSDSTAPDGGTGSQAQAEVDVACQKCVEAKKQECGEIYTKCKAEGAPVSQCQFATTFFCGFSNAFVDAGGDARGGDAAADAPTRD
jgi:hypothetical protein